MLAQRRLSARLVLIADETLLHDRARMLGLSWNGMPRFAGQSTAAGISLLHVPLSVPAQPGIPDPANSRYVLNTLERAADGCRDGLFDAMVTAPVHKGVINDAGIPFTGHTEYLAQRLHVPHVVMMLAGGGMRVALATTHLPLREVSAAITRESLELTLRVLHRELVARFAIARPRILVAGLNPHAGESGHLGREEIEVIEPVLARLRQEGLDLAGPWPADTLFQPERLQHCDCVLAMYHDQGLPVLKFADFGNGINVTLGLPVIRTSVDHGTALELAGSGRAKCDSLVAAVELAAELVLRSRHATQP